MSTEYLTSVNNRDIKSDVDLKKIIFTLTKKLKRKKLTCCIKLDSVKQYKNINNHLEEVDALDDDEIDDDVDAELEVDTLKTNTFTFTRS